MECSDSHAVTSTDWVKLPEARIVLLRKWAQLTGEPNTQYSQFGLR
ncbi:hypothetical protein MesoLj131b_77150 (plasmid) [Mesorhizobium sp. 131-2-5]|nr:hypothetical protein MesoLj131b_77150 [Mesorhizobium sp. 131-2-5]